MLRYLLDCFGNANAIWGLTFLRLMIIVSVGVSGLQTLLQANGGMSVPTLTTRAVFTVVV